jgi:hypothetical protein
MNLMDGAGISKSLLTRNAIIPKTKNNNVGLVIFDNRTWKLAAVSIVFFILFFQTLVAYPEFQISNFD